MDLNAFNLYRFCRWAEKTPTELLKLKDDPASKEAEYLLDEFVIAEKYHVPIEKVKGIFRLKRKNLEETEKALSQSDCSNGNHCQKIVVESELPMLLSAGWKFVATLQSGKVVVETT